MAASDPQPGEVYRHFRGRSYLVVAIASMEASGDQVVIYKSAHPGDPESLWVRPLAEWNAKVTVTVPRFELDQP